MPPTPHTINVRTTSATYDVHIATNLLATIGARVETLVTTTPRIFIITSPEIHTLHGATLSAGFTTPPTVLTIPAGEQHKRLATIENLAEQLSNARADRDSILLAFGGGVIGDMTGFLAAIYMRGIRYIGIPTTLLSQVDSSLGGKTGVNLATGKNLIGSFHHPLAVYADIDVLRTLPAAQLRAGLQESIKAGIIRDRALFDFLTDHSAEVLAGDPAALTRVVADSVRMKAAVVAADERETGVRMLLNLGHTLGHAIESATNYTQPLHGEAVAWGMLAATAIAKRRGLVTPAEHDLIERAIITYGPLRRFRADPAHLVDLTAKDKKNRSGARSFVLPRGIGDAVVVKDVTLEELTFTAERMMAMVARQDPS